MNPIRFLNFLAIIAGAILALTVYPMLYLFFGKEKETTKTV